MRGTGSRIIATGCTSLEGIGFHALKRLCQVSPAALPPPYHLILLARDPTARHALQARDELGALLTCVDSEHHSAVKGSDPPAKSVVELRAMDLADLSSVRQGAKKLLGDLCSHQLSASEADTAELEGLSGPWESIAREDVEASEKRGPFSEISAGRVDVLLLNAGIATAERELVMDDEDQSLTRAAGTRDVLGDDKGRYEKTACVNHIAQQLLVSLLLPHMVRSMPAPSNRASSSEGKESGSRPPRIVFTGSALHRRLREEAELDKYFGHSADAGYDARGTPPWSLMRTYGASKFLQMTGVQQLLSLLRQSPAAQSPASMNPPRTQCQVHVEVVVVQPGFIPSTGLNRAAPTWQRLLTHTVFPVLGTLNVLPFVSSVQEGATNVCDALVRPLESFPFSKSPAALGEGEGSTGKLGQPLDEDVLQLRDVWLRPAHDDPSEPDPVRAALIVKGGVREVPDLRTMRPDLRSKWWPGVVERAWGLGPAQAS